MGADMRILVKFESSGFIMYVHTAPTAYCSLSVLCATGLFAVFG